VQLKQLSSSADGNPGYHFKYKDSATQNNGRVQSINDVTSGEAITYLYDSLNRLTQASGAHDPQGSWSQQFTYDGFGNLIQKNGNNAPNNLTINVDPTTNRLTGNGAVYDANGNLTQYTNTLANMTFSYDSLNRLATASGWNGGSGNTANYGYDPSNQRVYSNINGAETFYFYGVDGKKLGAWTIVPFSSTLTLVSFNTWFGGRLLKPQDRLNSIGKYFPYGEDRYSPHPANPTNGTEKFATYTRDAETGLDYAHQRYYTAGLGRFMTPDPYGRSASLGNPQSLNRYPYSGNDPVGSNDPSGLDPGFFFYPIPEDPADSTLAGGGAGGQSGPKNIPADPPSNFLQCNPKGKFGIERRLNFIVNNYADAMAEAASVNKDVGGKANTGALATAFLSWSAGESTYGTDPSNIAQNNFFGVQNKGNTAGIYGGSTVACNRNGNPIVTNSTNACFAAGTTWGQELGIALDIVSTKTGVTYLSALEGALSGSTTAAQALQAIATNGWNRSSPYGSDKVSQTAPQPLIDCPLKYGYIP